MINNIVLWTLFCFTIIKILIIVFERITFKHTLRLQIEEMGHIAEFIKFINGGGHVKF